jgi:glycosyltransferase involved in cell wall biosynthesis
MPLITVIINLCNGEATLAEAVDSVLAQTFYDWELLIWDDCSIDDSHDVVHRYTDTRIRYVRSDTPVSLGEARQAAIELARGEWIAFLDQDDLWLPDKLQRQLALARAKLDVALIYGRTVRFYPGGMERDYDQAHEYTPLPEGDIFSSLFADSCYIAMSSAMFRRSAVAAIGGIPVALSIIPDYYLYTAVAKRYPAAAVQQVVCRYRMHPDNTSQTKAVTVHREALRLMDMWSNDVAPDVIAKCRRHHSTQIALAGMRSGATFFSGLNRLWHDGSVMSQVLRPFYFVFHLTRRSLITPIWRKN